MMLACYRKDEAHDPELYCAAIAAVLSEYPRAVIDRTTDPRTGVPSDLKFLPSVAEVRSFCNNEVARMARLAQPSLHPRLSERRQFVKQDQEKSYMKMFAKYGRPIGMFENEGDEWNRAKHRGMGGVLEAADAERARELAAKQAKAADWTSWEESK